MLVSVPHSSILPALLLRLEESLQVTAPQSENALPKVAHSLGRGLDSRCHRLAAGRGWLDRRGETAATSLVFALVIRKTLEHPQAFGG